MAPINVGGIPFPEYSLPLGWVSHQTRLSLRRQVARLHDAKEVTLTDHVRLDLESPVRRDGQQP